MIIKGYERKFELNVQSMLEIAAFCPGGAWENFPQLFGEGSAKSTENDIKIAIAMNRGYEDHMADSKPDYEPKYLTEADFRFLKPQDILTLEQELIQALNQGQEQEVAAEEIPSGKNANGAKE